MSFEFIINNLKFSFVAGGGLAVVVRATMVRIMSKKEQQDRLELLSSLNHVNNSMGLKHAAVNGKWFYYTHSSVLYQQLFISIGLSEYTVQVYSGIWKGIIV